MSGIVYSNATGWVTESIMLTAGEPWDANDPFVKDNPQHFSEGPGYALRSSGRIARERDVEQATAAPGEKRTARRTPRTSDDDS